MASPPPTPSLPPSILLPSSQAALESLIPQILSSTQIPDPFGTVAVLLAKTFTSRVDQQTIDQLYWFSAVNAVLLIASLSTLLIRGYRSWAMSGGDRSKRFMGVRLINIQDGFWVPGASILFLVMFVIYLICSEVYVWKQARLFKSETDYTGMEVLKGLNWGFLFLSGYVQVWGILCAANYNPSATRSMQNAPSSSLANRVTNGLPIPYLKRLFGGGKNEDGGRRKTSADYLFFSANVFNLVAIGIPIVYFVIQFITVGLAEHWCDTLFTDVTKSGKFAAQMSALNQTPANNQTALLVFEDLLVRMRNQANECKKGQETTGSLWGIWAAFLAIIDIVAYYYLARKLTTQIGLLDRAAADIRRAEKSGLMMTTGNDDDQDSPESGHQPTSSFAMAPAAALTRPDSIGSFPGSSPPGTATASEWGGQSASRHQHPANKSVDSFGGGNQNADADIQSTHTIGSTVFSGQMSNVAKQSLTVGRARGGTPMPSESQGAAIGSRMKFSRSLSDLAKVGTKTSGWEGKMEGGDGKRSNDGGKAKQVATAEARAKQMREIRNNLRFQCFALISGASILSVFAWCSVGLSRWIFFKGSVASFLSVAPQWIVTVFGTGILVVLIYKALTLDPSAQVGFLGNRIRAVTENPEFSSSQPKFKPTAPAAMSVHLNSASRRDVANISRAMVRPATVGEEDLEGLDLVESRGSKSPLDVMEPEALPPTTTGNYNTSLSEVAQTSVPTPATTQFSRLAHPYAYQDAPSPSSGSPPGLSPSDSRYGPAVPLISPSAQTQNQYQNQPPQPPPRRQQSFSSMGGGGATGHVNPQPTMMQEASQPSMHHQPMGSTSSAGGFQPYMFHQQVNHDELGQYPQPQSQQQQQEFIQDPIQQQSEDEYPHSPPANPAAAFYNSHVAQVYDPRTVGGHNSQAGSNGWGGGGPAGHRQVGSDASMMGGSGISPSHRDASGRRELPRPGSSSPPHQWQQHQQDGSWR